MTAAALLLAGCVAETELQVEPVVEPVVEEAAPQPQATTVTIRAVGDMLIHRDVFTTANAYADYTGYDFAPMFDPVRVYMQDADITTANMEVPVAGPELELGGYPHFNAPPEIIDALADAGVDVVNHATNHTMDRGGEGVVASIRNLRSRGMLVAGAYDSWEDKAQARIIDVDGVRVGFLAYTYGTNGMPVPAEYMVALIDHDAMRAEIAALERDADLTEVMIHMGEEYEPLPNDVQRDTASVAREAGADLVLGGHPHVLQPVDVAADSAVWFSHGNFLHGQHHEPTKVGGIGEFTFTQLDDAPLPLTSVRLMPVYTVGPPISYNHQVIPLAEAGEYIDVDAWFAELRGRMGDGVAVVEYL